MEDEIMPIFKRIRQKMEGLKKKLYEIKVRENEGI